MSDFDGKIKIQCYKFKFNTDGEAFLSYWCSQVPGTVGKITKYTPASKKILFNLNQL